MLAKATSISTTPDPEDPAVLNNGGQDDEEVVDVGAVGEETGDGEGAAVGEGVRSLPPKKPNDWKKALILSQKLPPRNRS
jgi:hypothetical protein